MTNSSSNQTLGKDIDLTEIIFVIAGADCLYFRYRRQGPKFYDQWIVRRTLPMNFGGHFIQGFVYAISCAVMMIYLTNQAAPIVSLLGAFTDPRKRFIFSRYGTQYVFRIKDLTKIVGTDPLFYDDFQ